MGKAQGACRAHATQQQRGVAAKSAVRAADRLVVTRFDQQATSELCGV